MWRRRYTIISFCTMIFSGACCRGRQDAGREERILIRWMSLCVVALTVAAVADEPRWTIDAKMSRITFTGWQMGAPSKGEFKKFSADIRFDPANLAASAVDVTIETASADT